MENEIKIEPIDHDILVLKFNCLIPAESRDQISKEIREEYKEGLSQSQDIIKSIVLSMRHIMYRQTILT